MGNSLKLINFPKAFPLGLLVSIMFFLTMFCLNKPNADMTSTVISLVAGLVCFILFLVSYVALDRCMATELIVQESGEDGLSFKEIFADVRYYFAPFTALVVLFVIAYTILIPTIGSVAGSIFQVDIAGFNFNILTLFINFCFMTWLFVGTAEIVSMDIGFIDTITYTFGFVFNHLAKVMGFLILLAFLALVFNFILLTTNGGSQLLMMPVKVLAFAYLFSLLNASAISLFINNVEEDDFDDTEEYDEDEE